MNPETQKTSDPWQQQAEKFSSGLYRMLGLKSLPDLQFEGTIDVPPGGGKTKLVGDLRPVAPATVE